MFKKIWCVWLVLLGFHGWLPAAAQKNSQADIPDDVKAEIAKLHSTDPIVRTQAAYSLREKKLRAIAAIPELIRLLGDSAPLKWAAGRETSPGEEAAQALGYEMGKAAFAPLLDAADSDDPVVRERAMWALSEIANISELHMKEKINSPQAVGMLISALNDPDYNVKVTAAWALRTINDKRAVAPLIMVLKDRALSKKKLIARGFVSRIGEEYINARKLAAEALGFIGEARAVEPLLAALHDADPLVRRTAPWALGRLKDARALEPLCKLLTDPDNAVIASAVNGLGDLGDSRAIEPLIALLKDEKRDHFALGTSDIDRNLEGALEKLTGKDFKAICKQYHVKSNSTLVNIEDNPFTTPVEKKQPAAAPAPLPVPAVPQKKIVVQGTIRYADRTPVVNRRFYLVEVNTKTNNVFIKFNKDGSEGIASAMTDQNGYFKAEADMGEFGKSDAPFTLIAYPGNNKKETPFSILTKKGASYWFAINPKTELYDFDRSGGAVYALDKDVDLAKAPSFSNLNLKAFKVNFYESGYEGAAKDQRVYATEFIGAQTRYINWELDLDFDDPGCRVDFVVEAIYTDRSGREITRQNLEAYVQGGWVNSWHTYSWGNKIAGKAWLPGAYFVELRIEGKRVAKASFTVK